MTDRIKALTVHYKIISNTVFLEKPIRTDDIEPFISAIRMLPGVLDVETHVHDIDTAVAEAKARSELGNKLLSVIYPPNN